MSSRSLRTLLTVAMDVLIVVAIADTVRLVVDFFGALSARGFGAAVIAITDRLIWPFGFAGVKTPYGGVFNIDCALTVILLLLAEWAISLVRSRA